MTAQQIDYWKLQESIRANTATEAENARYHKANESLQAQVNAETERHNKSIEAINRANLDINARNAAVNEANAATNARLASLTAQRDAETARHNASLERIQSEYNNALIGLKEYELDQKEEIASDDRSSRELIAEANLETSRSNVKTSAYTGLAGGIAGAALGVAGRLLTTRNVGSAVTKATTAASILSEIRSDPTAHLPTASTSAGLATAGASSLGSIVAPIAIAMGGGLILGKVLSDNNVTPFTPTFNNEELQKGVKWYGAE